MTHADPSLDEKPASDTRPVISKSKYMAGLQCGKLLWAHYNAKDSFPETDPGTQFRFDQGHQVGELAKQLFPEGIEVAPGHIDRHTVVEQTKLALQPRRPLFEPGFAYGGAFARIDLLVPVESGAWDLYEVKSTTRVKPQHIDDLSLQRYVLEGAGLSIRSCYLVHINSAYVKDGHLDPRAFLTAVDVTQQVVDRQAAVPANLERMHEVLRLEDTDSFGVGPHCTTPYDCALRGLCWDFMPDHGVDTLARFGQQKYDLIERGVLALSDLPDDTALSPIQQIQMAAVRSGEPQVDRPALAEFLSEWQYPLHFFDLETFALAIPIHNGCRPYQAIPFQFSLHIVDRPGAEPRHLPFLAEDAEDPRPAFMARLRDTIGPHGSVVAYNAPFEKRILTDTVAALPHYAAWFAELESRFVDLYLPFRSFHFYHPAQRGSASLKAVLPALTGQSYADLDLNRGDLAGPEFLRVVVFDPDATDRDTVRQRLEAYCSLDTEGLILVHRELTRLVRST